MSDTHRVDPGIVFRGVRFAFGETDVLRNINLEVPRGTTAVVTGRNGSGKSTLLYLAAGLISVHSGVVTLAGKRADAWHPSDMFRRGVRRGFVFQEGGLLNNMNALANVALPLRYHADVLGLTLEQVEGRALRALERVRLEPSQYYALPAHLSFGNRKRLALARALAIEPNFFFFDDPDVGLDPKTAALVHEILCAYRDDPNVTMLVATNRDLLIERLGVPGYVLHEGKLVAHATAPRSSLTPATA